MQSWIITRANHCWSSRDQATAIAHSSTTLELPCECIFHLHNWFYLLDFIAFFTLLASVLDDHPTLTPPHLIPSYPVHTPPHLNPSYTVHAPPHLILPHLTSSSSPTPSPSSRQADSYLYAMTNTYTLGVPLIANGRGGNASKSTRFHHCRVRILYFYLSLFLAC